MSLLSFPGRLFLSFLIVMCPSVHAEDSKKNFFDRDESIRYDQNNGGDFINRDSNRFDQAPQLFIKQFRIDGVSDHHPEINKDELDDIAAQHIEEHQGRYTVDELHQLAQIITRYYRVRGLFLARAYIPEQDIINHTVTIKVLEGRLGQVRFNNLELYEEDTLTQPFKDQLGLPIQQDTIESSILLMSTYPGLTTTTVFSPGEQPGEADLVINVNKEEPYTAQASFDNYGSEFTGKFRGQLSGQINDISNAADFLKLNLLLTVNPANTVYGGLYYERPMEYHFTGKRTRFLNSVFGKGFSFGFGLNRNSFEVGQELANLDISGTSRNIDFHFKKSILRQPTLRLDSAVNLHLKNARTEQAGGTLLGEDNLTVLEWDTHYQFHSSLWGDAINEARFTYNLGIPDLLGAMGTDGDGTSSRIGSSGDRAGGDFSRINLEYQRIQRLKQQTLLTRFYLQNSSDLLTPVEQFSLGGPYNVRGYLNSDFVVDNAIGLSFELIGYAQAEKFTLPISNVKVAAVLDYASGNRNDPLPNEVSSVTLTAIGGYAEFLYQDKIQARLDLGIPLSSAEPSNENSFQLFFHLTYPL